MPKLGVRGPIGSRFGVAKLKAATQRLRNRTRRTGAGRIANGEMRCAHDHGPEP